MRIYLLTLISFLIGTAEYIIAGILEQIAQDLKLPVPLIGQMITVFSIAFAVGTPIVITLTAQFDRKKLLIGFMLVFAVANLSTILLTSYGLLNVSRAVSGLSAGVVEVILLTLAAILAAPGKKAGAIAMVVVGFSAALVVGVPLGRVVSGMMDWRYIFLGLGLLTLISLIAVIHVIPGTQGETAIPLRQQLKLLKNKQISLVYVMTFFWISAFSIIYSYISPYLSSVSHMADGEISIMLLVCGLASIAGSQLGGRFTDRSGYVLTLLAGLLLHCATLVLFALFGQISWVMYVLLISWSVSAWSSGPALQFRLISLAPESTGIIFSLYASMIQFGMAAGAIVGALVIQAGSLSDISMVGAASVFLSLLLLAKITPAANRPALDVCVSAEKS
ncbi:MFS transporter [Janthinobacterium agaricidamnosum]|nr:MFS transporter [Janthinobacterium agaricidamnosum]